jgi:peptidoglycan/LPS O-acetylase OafA/YrhL
MAILMVMLYHFNQGHAAPLEGTVLANISKVLRLGGSGVDLFFVLSGFLITGILYDSKQARGYFRNFYIRRTLRIFPLYYAVLVIVLFVVPAIPALEVLRNQDAFNRQVWLWLYGANILQAQQETLYLFGGFSHFWSLAVEEHFYLLWPVVIFVCNRKAAMWVCGACVAAAVALRFGLMAAGDHAISAYVLTPCRMDALAVGAFIALAARGPRGMAGLFRTAAVGAILAAGLIGYLFYAKAGLTRMDASVVVVRFILSAWLFGAVLLFAVCASPTSLAGRCWSCPPLRVLGKYSYALYVFHYPLIPLFMTLFSPARLETHIGSALVARLAYFVLCGAASLLAAMLSWRLYEKHFLRLKDVLAPR